MENKIMLANIFELKEELKIEKEENDRLTQEIGDMKRAKKLADDRTMEDVEYARMLNLDIKELKIAAKTAEAEIDNLHKEMIVLRYDRQELREEVEYWRTRAELFVSQARVLGQQIEQIKAAILGGRND